MVPSGERGFQLCTVVLLIAISSIRKVETTLSNLGKGRYIFIVKDTICVNLSLIPCRREYWCD
jgi:hypothetical protein